MSKAPEGLRVLIEGFMIWNSHGGDGFCPEPEDGEIYAGLELAQGIAEREWLSRFQKTRLVWREVAGLPRWKMCTDYGPPVSARPQDTGWHIDGVRVLGVSDGLCHEVAISGDCGYGLDHPGSHDWER